MSRVDSVFRSSAWARVSEEPALPGTFEATTRNTVEITQPLGMPAPAKTPVEEVTRPQRLSRKRDSRTVALGGDIHARQVRVRLLQQTANSTANACNNQDEVEPEQPA